MIAVKERNNYKEFFTKSLMKKRGQLAIFVIVAIVIVVAGVLVYLFYPNIAGIIGGEVSPNTFLRECMQPEVKATMEMLAKQGGYEDPEGFILYKGNEVKYLCYNAQYYQLCKVQQPLIKGHFEKELNRILEVKAERCIIEMESEFSARGYDVSSTGAGAKAEILPGKVLVSFDTQMTLSKDETQTFRGFSVNIPSEMYFLLMTATSIVDYESNYGDSETTLYMSYYPNLRIEKTKLSDGSTVYVLEDVTTAETFTFASRSLAWPPGYGGLTK